MRIGLISDTHGYLDAWEKALQVFGAIDFAIHTGDILSSGPFNPRTAAYKPVDLAEAMNGALFPLIFTKGNCDAEVDSMALAYPILAPYAFVYANGLKILATHGHLYNEEKLVDMGSLYGIDVIVSGHTHLRGINVRDSITLVNPGSAALPKTEDEIPTVGIIENGVISLISLIDGSEIERVEIPRK